MPILLTAAVVCSLLRNRAGILVGLVAAALVTLATFGSALGGDLTGGLGLARAAGRWLELTGLAAAILIAVTALRSQGALPAGPVAADVIDRSEVQRGRRGDRERRGGPAGQVVGLLVLCAVGAELLSAYSDTTGDPVGIAFSVVFFAALYGAPALLVRELARRRGWGWPSMLLAFAALGVAQACLIDQSMFSVDYQDYEGWEEARQATLVSGLGISAYNAFNFIVGHLIFSFAAPVALVEAWHPERAEKPWLGVRGLALAALAYLGAAALILSDPTSHSGTAAQLTVSALLVLGLLGLAVLVGRGPSEAGREEDSGRAGSTTLPLWKLFTAVFTGALVASLGPETWIGLALGAAATVAVGVGVLMASRRTRWSPRHTAAVALAFLSVRGLLAFTYYPLLGEVEATNRFKTPERSHPFTAALLWLNDGPRRAAMEGAGVHVVGRP